MMKLSFLLLISVSACLFNTCESVNQNRDSEDTHKIEISSSNGELDEAFKWAVEKAGSFVMTGKSGSVNKSEKYEGDRSYRYIPCYWAGYPFRSAFYSRDFCHQMAGAHLLGLDEENFRMMKTFAASSNSARGWYPLWSFNFDGSPYMLDYGSDDSFVREVPAPFELVQKAYQAYMWTGDKRYLNDKTLLYYYRKTVSDFISEHDKLMPDGIAEGNGSGNIFAGTATYNEGMYENPFIEAGDGIGSQYQAYLGYAGILYAKGDSAEADIWKEKANFLKDYFEKVWASEKYGSVYVSGYDTNRKARTEFGKEPTWFMAMKHIINDGERGNIFLDFIQKSLENPSDLPVNIEAITYLPDTFFPYGRIEDGWKWFDYILKNYQKPHSVKEVGMNGDYPEVSFVIISSVVENLMGIVPDAPHDAASSVSRLPDEMSFLTVKNINIGTHSICVTHNGRNSTSVFYSKGRGNFHFTFRFYGNHPELQVNGQFRKSTPGSLYGKEISSITLTLKPLDRVTVGI
ncbi:MAG: hypothetical protein LKI53_03790 [Bacteroidales bacterium]|jgi:hypothetical protein|nr:hypothetical protein [Bacteroidales bacterium]